MFWNEHLPRRATTKRLKNVGGHGSVSVVGNRVVFMLVILVFFWDFFPAVDELHFMKG